ncbi:MAG: hypothetical protein SFU99_11750 [Saprospiraceae bacterium]|nr:hypothetical protein [Saprospiraceae bacterium]
MVDVISQKEQQNKRYGMIISTIIHTVLILLALLPMVYFQNPPPEQEGILVNLGLPDVGQGNENAGPAEPVAEEESKPEEEAEPEPVKEREVEKPAKTEPTPQKEVVKTEDPEAVALREQKKREKEEQDRQAREEAAKRKAAEDAKKKAEAEQAAREAEAKRLKDQLAGGFSGSGGGKGNTGKPGNQGDPNGDPNAKNLEGISTGKGDVGGGLDARGILKRGPGVTDNSQSVGNAVIRVCIDKDGNVTSAEFTQKGSTIADGALKNKAIADAKQWKFGKGEVDTQCGTITYRFKLQ